MRQKSPSSDFFSSSSWSGTTAQVSLLTAFVLLLLQSLQTKFILCRDRKEGTMAMGRALWGQHHFLTE